MTKPFVWWVWILCLWHGLQWCRESWSSVCPLDSALPTTCLSRSLVEQSEEVGQIFQRLWGHSNGLCEHTVSFVACAYSNYINLHAGEKWIVITAATGIQGHILIREIPLHLWSKVIYSSQKAKWAWSSFINMGFLWMCLCMSVEEFIWVCREMVTHINV